MSKERRSAWATWGPCFHFPMFQSKQNNKDSVHFITQVTYCTNKYTAITNNILSFSLTVKLCDQLATNTHISLTKKWNFVKWTWMEPPWKSGSKLRQNAWSLGKYSLWIMLSHPAWMRLPCLHHSLEGLLFSIHERTCEFLLYCFWYSCGKIGC